MPANLNVTFTLNECQHLAKQRLCGLAVVGCHKAPARNNAQTTSQLFSKPLARIWSIAFGHRLKYVPHQVAPWVAVFGISAHLHLFRSPGCVFSTNAETTHVAFFSMSVFCHELTTNRPTDRPCRRWTYRGARTAHHLITSSTTRMR